MTIGATVNRLGRQAFDVIRRSGFYEQGRYVTRDDETIHARGNVQPATADDLKRLPEGSRTDGTISIWGAFRLDTCCLFELKNGGAPNEVPDRIVYDGAVYEVQTAEHWPRHSRYLCSKAKQ